MRVPIITIDRLSDPTAIRELLCPTGPTPRTPSLSSTLRSSVRPNGTRLGARRVVRFYCTRAVVSDRRSSPSGDPAALEAALSLHPGPRFSFGSLRPEHRPPSRSISCSRRPQTMLRMSVSAERFSPVTSRAVRLTGRDTSQINRSYSSEGGPSSYRRATSRRASTTASSSTAAWSRSPARTSSRIRKASLWSATSSPIPLYRGGGLATYRHQRDDRRPARALPAGRPHGRGGERARRARLPAPRLRAVLHSARVAPDPQGAGRRDSASSGASSPAGAGAPKGRRSSRR